MPVTMLTAKQFEALDYLLEGDVEHNGSISARQLMGLYEQRWAAERRAKGQETWHSTNRNHGWRRSAGTVLERMRRDGLLYTTHVNYGSFDYALTDEGKAAYLQYQIKPGQLRKGSFGVYLVVRPALANNGKPSTQWWASHSVFPENLRATKLHAKMLREMPLTDWDFFGGRDYSPWSLVVEDMISETPA
jgi:hypothetical protein